MQQNAISSNECSTHVRRICWMVWSTTAGVRKARARDRVQKVRKYRSGPRYEHVSSRRGRDTVIRVANDVPARRIPKASASRVSCAGSEGPGLPIVFLASGPKDPAYGRARALLADVALHTAAAAVFRILQ